MSAKYDAKKNRKKFKALKLITDQVNLLPFSKIFEIVYTAVNMHTQFEK